MRAARAHREPMDAVRASPELWIHTPQGVV